jgi:hypothetical protein
VEDVQDSSADVQPWLDALPIGDQQKRRLGLNVPSLLGPLASLRPASTLTPDAAPPLATASRAGTSLAVTPKTPVPLADASRIDPHSGTVTTSTDGVPATNRDSTGASRLNVSPTGDVKRNLAITPGNFYAGAESRPQVPTIPPSINIANTRETPSILEASRAAQPAPASTDNLLAIQPRTKPAPLSFKERQALPTTSPGAPAGSAASYQAKLERIEDQRANPWGSPENHPGLAGKVGHVLSRIGNIAGDIAAPGTMAIIPGTDLNRNLRESGLENRFETASDREDRVATERVRQAQTEEQRRIEERRNEILDRRNDILEGKQPKLTPDEGAIADLQKQINPKTGKAYTAYEARVKLAQDIQDTKPGGHTSPFEAFAYGTPQEKKAAQDFLAFEKRMGAQYQRPTEAEFRYQLYQRDPEGYKAMFGDKAASGDRAHAAKMLNFFQKQRTEISKNFMLGDDEKAQQLQEIDEMEKPFMDTARGNGAGGNGDRVNVIHPDGTQGTVPRSQLGAAKRKGYRVAQ